MARLAWHTARERRHTINPQIADLERQLNDFSLDTRLRALAQLVELAKQGEVPLEPETDVANMHCHTFFSFNAYGHSPASLAWLAKRCGFKAIGTVDFDVLDAVDEFLAACDRVGVRGSTGLETRVYVPEFGTREINSPGEPGVAYHMGIGFASGHVPDRVSQLAAGLLERAAQRNREMVTRVNTFLKPVVIDYDRDVLPLTPAGNPTERHMLVAYVAAAEKLTPSPVEFWAGKLGLPPEQVGKTIGDAPRFQNLLRQKLMKRGGVGYVQPGPASFPSIDEVNSFTAACGALPCVAWLDGTSAGEQAIEELLELDVRKGAVALNIVPDRNWNIADPEVKRIKVQKLYEIVRLAEQLDLPLNIGTEMNTFGQKVVDDLGAPELAPVRQAFLDGAHLFYGHTMLQRALGLGYSSAWARTQLPSRRARNAFYVQVGYAVQPGTASLAKLKQLDKTLTPAELLACWEK